MSTPNRDRGLGEALAALTSPALDVADVLAHLVSDFADLTDGGAAAILAQDSQERLAMLAVTSHRAAELEMLQSQESTGPCVDAMRTATPVAASGADALVERWGDVGRAIVDAGYDSVRAYPMCWHGQALGGLNLFLPAGAEVPGGRLARAYADVATLALVQSVVISGEQVRARLHEALEDRELIEQAKGVLAQADGLDMDAAYQRLLELAEESPSTLTHVAGEVVRRRGRL